MSWPRSCTTTAADCRPSERKDGWDTPAAPASPRAGRGLGARRPQTFRTARFPGDRRHVQRQIWVAVARTAPPTRRRGPPGTVDEAMLAGVVRPIDIDGARSSPRGAHNPEWLDRQLGFGWLTAGNRRQLDSSPPRSAAAGVAKAAARSSKGGVRLTDASWAASSATRVSPSPRDRRDGGYEHRPDPQPRAD